MLFNGILRYFEANVEIWLLCFFCYFLHFSQLRLKSACLSDYLETSKKMGSPAPTFWAMRESKHSLLESILLQTSIFYAGSRSLTTLTSQVVWNRGRVVIQRIRSSECSSGLRDNHVAVSSCEGCSPLDQEDRQLPHMVDQHHHCRHHRLHHWHHLVSESYPL